MKALTYALSVAVASLALATGATAQTSHDHASMQAQASTSAKAVLADGEVRKIDRAKGTVTLKHGPLTALNMPPMTMSFVAKNPAILANVKEGDKVRFAYELGKDGELVVTALTVVTK